MTRCPLHDAISEHAAKCVRAQHAILEGMIKVWVEDTGLTVHDAVLVQRTTDRGLEFSIERKL